MSRVLSISAISLAAYVALTIPTILTLNNIVNRSQESRLNVHRAELDSLSRKIEQLQLELKSRNP